MIAALAARLREGAGIAHKRDIAPVLGRLGLAAQGIRLGDDCAAIPDGDGFLLLAIEGFLPRFVAADPWFAGWCGVMVNAADIAAMGGRPIAVVDAFWSRGDDAAAPLLRGLAEAAAAYGIPIVGGHSNSRAEFSALSVAILGRAEKLLSSFAARPGETLLAAIDLRGRYRDPDPFWDAASGAGRAGLRADFDLLAEIAEAGLSRAAKDISMAGLLGTALMLAEASGIGMTIDLAAVPRPAGADLARWLSGFPSFGFLLTATPQDVPAIVARFAARGIACAAIGQCEAGSRLDVIDADAREIFWDLAQSPLIGSFA